MRTKLRKVVRDHLKLLGFQREGKLFTRRSDYLVAMVTMYSGRINPELMVDTGLIDERFPVRDRNYAIFWHTHARLERWSVDDQVAKQIRLAMTYGSDVELEMRKDLIVEALDTYDYHLRSKWQNKEWMESILEKSQDELMAVSRPYLKMRVEASQ